MYTLYNYTVYTQITCISTHQVILLNYSTACVEEWGLLLYVWGPSVTQKGDLCLTEACMSSDTFTFWIPPQNIQNKVPWLQPRRSKAWYPFSRMRSKGSRFPLGVEGVFARRCRTVRNRPQPSAPVRNRSHPSATVPAIAIWPCLW